MGGRAGVGIRTDITGMWARFTFSSSIHTRNVRNDGNARDNIQTCVSCPNPEGICIDNMYMIVCECVYVCWWDVYASGRRRGCECVWRGGVNNVHISIIWSPSKLEVGAVWEELSSDAYVTTPWSLSCEELIQGFCSPWTSAQSLLVATINIQVKCPYCLWHSNARSQLCWCSGNEPNGQTGSTPSLQLIHTWLHICVRLCFHV